VKVLGMLIMMPPIVHKVGRLAEGGRPTGWPGFMETRQAVKVAGLM
jgi:hypothetical protein